MIGCNYTPIAPAFCTSTLTELRQIFCLAGIFTGEIIRLISDIRLKHGVKAVELDGCGCFELASDLTDVANITHIDLSDIRSLKGMWFVKSSSIER